MNTDIDALTARFGSRMKRDVPLARYTTVRIGGPSDHLLVARSKDALCTGAALAWQAGLALLLLGGGANVLIDDAGFRGLTMINRARSLHHSGTTVTVASGVSLAALARYCITHGLAGLTWAWGIPGTLGGALINNAGAHGGALSDVVQTVEVLRRGAAPAVWPVEAMGYGYRTSALKQRRGYVVLGATLTLDRADPAELRARAEALGARRKAGQPPGASLGSVFKNPPGDYAGRLIEAAGLKGARIGGALISPTHANFFINTGGASAADYRALIDKARDAVEAQFGVRLELEIEIITA